MWNDLRDQNEQQQTYFQDDTPEDAEEAAPAAKSGGLNLKALTREPILGMTAAQRFVIATMLLMTVCILGSMFMLVTGTFAIF